jgi:hypothetical protein
MCLVLVPGVFTLSSSLQGQDTYWNRFKNAVGVTKQPIEYEYSYNVENPRAKKYPSAKDRLKLKKKFILEEHPTNPSILERHTNMSGTAGLASYPSAIEPIAVQGLVYSGRAQGYKKGLTHAGYGLGAAAAVGAVGYGLYSLYNWYRGDLHALEQHVKVAETAIDKAIKIVEKESKVAGNEILITDIYNTKTTLNKIHASVVKEQARRKRKTDSINTEELTETVKYLIGLARKEMPMMNPDWNKMGQNNKELARDLEQLQKDLNHTNWQETVNAFCKKWRLNPISIREVINKK